MTSRRKQQQSKTNSVVITCEHGGYQVPPSYRHLFKDAGEILRTHRGWDPGALKLAQLFAAKLSSTIFSATVTRLLVELNRSRGHSRLFSEFTQGLSSDEKAKLLAEHWYPYRTAVESAIAEQIDDGHVVLHLSVHSFTPIWEGTPRKTDVGLLYDPARPLEFDFCNRWQAALRSGSPELTIHRNAPYRGTSDGFVTALRRQFAASRYVGIELEVNQKFFNAAQKCRSDLAKLLIWSLQQTIDTR